MNLFGRIPKVVAKKFEEKWVSVDKNNWSLYEFDNGRKVYSLYEKWWDINVVTVKNFLKTKIINCFVRWRLLLVDDIKDKPLSEKIKNKLADSKKFELREYEEEDWLEKYELSIYYKKWWLREVVYFNK